MEGNQAVQAKEQRMVPGLYEERFEHDNCGIGAVVNIKGIKTHKTVDNALKIADRIRPILGKDEILIVGGQAGKLQPSGPRRFIDPQSLAVGDRLGIDLAARLIALALAMIDAHLYAVVADP